MIDVLNMSVEDHARKQLQMHAIVRLEINIGVADLGDPPTRQI